MTSESLQIIKMMVDEGLTVEEIANHFDLSEAEAMKFIKTALCKQKDAGADKDRLSNTEGTIDE